MGETLGSLRGHAAAAVCLALLFVRPAFAQGPGVEGGDITVPPAPTSAQFMSRTDLHLSAAALSTDDPRFKWDTHFGGDIDVVDYVSGRVRVIADYQAMLGNEYRPFDPNQGNYVLEASASRRIAGFEFAGVFHHESRHLSDRPKRFAVAWNVLGGRVLKHVEIARTVIEGEAGFGATVQHSYVDYKWIGDADLLVRHTLSPHAAVYARGTGTLYGVTGLYGDSTVPRGTQTGGRAEVGLRLEGRRGALELFAGAERMVDAYQLEPIAISWPFAGFRFVSR